MKKSRPHLDGESWYPFGHRTVPIVYYYCFKFENNDKSSHLIDDSG